MLHGKQRESFEQFRSSTHLNDHLDGREETLVGLTAAIALNCQPCIRYYWKKAMDSGISENEISELLAKVMAVSANQKRFQAEVVIKGISDRSLEGDDDS